MLIPSKAFDLWRRLYTRFVLEPPPLEASTAALEGTVQPVTAVDVLLQVHKAVTETTPYVATGALEVLTVPTGKRWLLHSVRVARSGGDGTIVELRLYDASEGLRAELVSQAAASSILHLPNTPYPMDQNDQISISIDAMTVGGNMIARAWVTEEDAY